jgi:hypothetical protein
MISCSLWTGLDHVRFMFVTPLGRLRRINAVPTISCSMYLIRVRWSQFTYICHKFWQKASFCLYFPSPTFNEQDATPWCKLYLQNYHIFLGVFEDGHGVETTIKLVHALQSCFYTVSQLQIYSLLLNAQHCHHLLVWKVANKMQESLNSKECYQQDGIRSGKKGQSPG